MGRVRWGREEWVWKTEGKEKTVGNDSGCGEYGEGSSGIEEGFWMIWLIGGVERETKSIQVGIGRLYGSETKLIMKYLQTKWCWKKGFS